MAVVSLPTDSSPPLSINSSDTVPISRIMTIAERRRRTPRSGSAYGSSNSTAAEYTEGWILIY